MSRTIAISYDLNPPAGTCTANLVAQKDHSFDVKGSVADGQREYYEALRGAIGEMKNVLGEELTAWRDAVGNREQDREAKKEVKDVEEEEEEPEDEEP